MRKFLFSGLMAGFICLAVLYPTAPAYSQAGGSVNSCPDPTIIEPPMPPTGCPPNWPVNPLQRHPPQVNIVNQAIQELELMGYDLSIGDCSIPQGTCCGDCGAGIITVRVAQILGIGILDKNYGAGCDGHSFDIIIFPDGYIYDILGSGGTLNIPAWMPTCCGIPSDQGGDGTCADRYMDPNLLQFDIPNPAPPACRRAGWCPPGTPPPCP